MSNNLKIKLHEAMQNNDGEDSYRFAKIIYTFKNPYGVKETFSDIVHFRDRIPVDSIKDKAIESFYDSMRVNGFIPVGKEDEHVVVLEAANGKLCKAEYSDKDRPFKIDYTKYAKPGALRKFVTVVDVIWSNDMYDEFWQGNQYLIDQVRKRDKERDECGEYSEAVSKVLSDATIKCSMQKKKESLLKKKKVREENLDLEELKKVEAGLFAQLKAKCKQRPVQRVWNAKDFLTKWGLNSDDKLAISALFEADYYEREDADEMPSEESYVYVKGDVFYENYKYDLYETNHGKESEESLIRTCIDTLKTMLKADSVTVFDNNLY